MAAFKRSRAVFETEGPPQHSPFVLYGTPLPPLDPDTRDDGSYVPLWKQEVTDERGRKRLHGAFTGGFSAGYFNTVGSKDGWTPSSFVSSRSQKPKDTSKPSAQRPEDFMDEEDLADLAETQKLQTSGSFAGLGSTEEDVARNGRSVDIWRPGGDTMGVKLLKKMGWRDGQGVGPKVRRAARWDADGEGGEGDHTSGETHLFAPDDTELIPLVRKNDRKGLGYEGESRLAPTNGLAVAPEEDEEDSLGLGITSRATTKAKERPRGALGVGILNDTGSDDEDPYAIGPKLSYTRVIGGEKKAKKRRKTGTAATGRSAANPNPLLDVKPVFMSKKSSGTGKLAGFRRCHDGRLPLDGFVLSSQHDPLVSVDAGRFQPPEVPRDWKSTKDPGSSQTATYQSTADAARASKLDPKSRASLLGEAPLPGKSVFDFLSPAARDRLVSASGKTGLPVGRGEAPPEGYGASEEEKQRSLHQAIPKVSAEVATKALGRGIGGWMPYAEDEAKRARYRAYLEGQAGLRSGLPDHALGMSKDDWLKELGEFAHAAEIFKPMTGMMASRFTSSSTQPRLASDVPEGAVKTDGLLSMPSKKVEDPAEAAAKIGMFGPMTRSLHQFYPSRLVCKRFNVKAPSHVSVDADSTAGQSERGTGTRPAESLPNRTLELVSKSVMETMLQESPHATSESHVTDHGDGSGSIGLPTPVEVVNVEHNAALEADRPGEAVFKAIFGSDDEEDE
ncbi:MAG: hypothetical protein M1838_004616 [Thelocarpon superellum]|nr:MAG: hypothetical protein M1838_004616 [Thelocarpon superellum]